jgi:spermidine synthase
MTTHPTPHKLLFSIGFLSAAIIAFQLALIQILSIIQWHHFAYMVISMAMLGFGAAGTTLALARQKLVRHSNHFIPLLMMATGIAMALVTGMSQWPFVRFDSYLLFTGFSQIGKLLATYLLFFVPFFLGALAIGIIFVQHVHDIGKIYFADLLGSGAGGVMAVAIIWLVIPARLPSVISILPVLAGVLILPNKKTILHVFVAIMAIGISMWTIVNPPRLILSQYKDLSKSLLLPDAEIKLERTSPYGFTQAVTSPVLRYAPGLSLTAQQAAHVNMALFTNGNWFGVITGPRADSMMVLDFSTFALPYAIARRRKVLVLKAGTGMDVAHALARGAEKIVAAEANSVVVSALKKELADENDSLFYDPKIELHTLEPRTFLLRDTSHYDLIVLPVVGAFGGVAGLHALHEQFMLTKESFRDMWHRLDEGGVISVTSWLDYPARNPLKILATMIEVIEELDIRDPRNHIAAVRSWGTITFVLSKSALTETDINNTRTFSDQMLFDPLLLPGLKPEERSRYNQLEDERLFTFVDQLLSPARTELYEDYDFNIRPATDNTPYFSQFLRLKSFQRVAKFFGDRVPFLEIGYLLVIVTLIQITLVSFALILLPLFRLGWKGENKWTTILYFGGIGIGYMFVEMVFIQRFILYLGNPVYATSAVITLLLISSSVGSYTSRYFRERVKSMTIMLSVIVVVLLVYSLILTPVLQQTVHLSFPLKMLMISLVVIPLAFCMGLPFPNGLFYVSQTSPPQIPWAWGINGCASVIATALATIIAVEMGFTLVMCTAALAYCLPLIVQMKWSRSR